MANEIYHRTNWGEAKPEGFGDMYFDPSATNKLYNRSTYYENSDATDKILGDIPNKASIVLTPTGYSEDSINTAIPPYQVLPTNIVTNGTFDTDSDWTKETGWTISNGKANFNASLSTAGYIIQTNILELGKKYKLNATVDEGQVSLISAFYDVQQGENIQTGTSSIFTVTSGTDLRLYSHPSNGNASITDITVQEIQEADFTFARNSSATRVNQTGLIEASQSNDTPRLDYTTGQGAFLLEPQSTNLITYSEDLISGSGGTSTQNGILTESSTLVDPTGNTNAVTYTNPGNINGSLKKSATVSADVNLVLSIYIKKTSDSNFSSNSKARLEMFNNTASTSATLLGDLINQATVGQWVRYSTTAVADSDGGSVVCALRTDEAYSFDIFGFQLEEGTFATSYIPTVGSTVTRSAETANSSGNSDLFNSTEGVFYSEISALASDSTAKEITLSDGTTNNRVIISYNTANQIRINYRKASSNIFDQTKTITITESNKVAVKYKLNDFSFYVNGSNIASSTSGSVMSANTLTQLNFDDGSGSFDFYGKAKGVAVFKEALTDIELEKLTSWRDFRDLAESLEYTLVTIKSDAIVVSAYGTTSGGGGVSGGGSGGGGGY